LYNLIAGYISSHEAILFENEQPFTSRVMSALRLRRDDQFLARPLKEDSASNSGTVLWPNPDSMVTWTTCRPAHYITNQPAYVWECVLGGWLNQPHLAQLESGVGGATNLWCIA